MAKKLTKAHLEEMIRERTNHITELNKEIIELKQSREDIRKNEGTANRRVSLAQAHIHNLNREVEEIKKSNVKYFYMSMFFLVLAVIAFVF